MAKHDGFPLFNAQECAYHVLRELFQGAPNQDQVLGAMELKLNNREYSDDKCHVCRTNGRALEDHLHAGALGCLRRHLGTQDVGHNICNTGFENHPPSVYARTYVRKLLGHGAPELWK